MPKTNGIYVMADVRGGVGWGDIVLGAIVPLVKCMQPVFARMECMLS